MLLISFEKLLHQRRLKRVILRSVAKKTLLEMALIELASAEAVIMVHALILSELKGVTN